MLPVSQRTIEGKGAPNPAMGVLPSIRVGAGRAVAFSGAGTPMRNLAIKVIDRLFIVVYGARDPTDEEWDAYLALAEQHGIAQTMQLICTDGGEPTATQRRKLNERLGGRTVPVAVVSSSQRVRATVTALSWFNRRIKAFPLSGLSDALEYLEVPASRTELIEREIRLLRLELSQGSRASA
jgi:hypothetical protein